MLRRARDAQGQAMVEYGLILAFVAGAAILAYQAFGGVVFGLYDRFVSALT